MERCTLDGRMLMIRRVRRQKKKRICSNARYRLSITDQASKVRYVFHIILKLIRILLKVMINFSFLTQINSIQETFKIKANPD